MTELRNRNVEVLSGLEGWYRGTFSWDIGRISCSRRDGGEAHNKWMTRGGVTMIIIRTFDLTDLFILAQRAKANYLKFTPSPLYSCSFIPPSSHLFPPATWTFSLDMDRILSPHSPEVIAHNHFQWANFFTLSLGHFLSFSFRENWFSWDLYDINEPLVSNCASYSAFERYTSGTDLYILPHTSGRFNKSCWIFCKHDPSPIFDVLSHPFLSVSYAYDAIHNAIATSRSTLQPGGYSRVCG